MDKKIGRVFIVLRRGWGPILLGLTLLWVFWPVLTALARSWATQPQYSHGYLVPLFALYLLWARRGRLRGDCRPNWCGLFLLAVGLLLHFAGAVFYFEWLSQAALIPCL